VLGAAGAGQDRIDHLERNNLGQLPQVARREHPFGYRDFTRDDTLSRQRSSSRRAILVESPSTGAPLLLSGDPHNHSTRLQPEAKR
jgi:hypothetical protein